jgi:hypothetical protein
LYKDCWEGGLYWDQQFTFFGLPVDDWPSNIKDDLVNHFLIVILSELKQIMTAITFTFGSSDPVLANSTMFITGYTAARTLTPVNLIIFTTKN